MIIIKLSLKGAVGGMKVKLKLINFVQGALKEMFPKCSHAEIPSQSAKKGTPFGFVQFSSAGDAKEWRHILLNALSNKISQRDFTLLMIQINKPGQSLG